jgi:hypothetical protein
MEGASVAGAEKERYLGRIHPGDVQSQDLEDLKRLLRMSEPQAGGRFWWRP